MFDGLTSSVVLLVFLLEEHDVSKSVTIAKEEMNFFKVACFISSNIMQEADMQNDS